MERLSRAQFGASVLAKRADAGDSYTLGPEVLGVGFGTDVSFACLEGGPAIHRPIPTPVWRNTGRIATRSVEIRLKARLVMLAHTYCHYDRPRHASIPSLKISTMNSIE